MSDYKTVVNPYDGKLTIVRADSAFAVKGSVATYNDLPISGNSENDLRITRDTDKMYTWSISGASGSLSDWDEIGTVSSVDWSAINNKPTSTVADIDLAVTHKDITTGNPHSVSKSDVGLGNVSNVNLTYSTINYVIDGGGSEITTGEKDVIRIPSGFNGNITGVTLLADQSGSIVIDIWKDTYANYAPTVADTITASAKPTLSSAIKNEDTTLTGWTKTLSSGDILKFNVDSCTTITKCTIILDITRT